jgi:hypothetical protein
MMKGMLMPFFGAGVNLSNRSPGITYVPNGPYLPNASELSDELLREFELNLPNPCELADPRARCKWKEQSLVRVSWYVSTQKGKSDLYEHLHKLFCSGTPSDVHEFFARFPKRLEEKGYEVPQQLIVTTNYDVLLERAFDLAESPYDVFSYTMDRDSELGKFSHTPYGHDPVDPIPIENPTKYDPEIEHTIIVKIHGTAHPKNWQDSTFVITEDDYIDYAAFVRLDKIPSVLANRMLDRRFLYLGYSLSDWNFRVFLRGIKARSRFADDRTWAIMHRYDEWDRLYWQEHNVEILQMHLRDHINMLNEIVDDLPKRA